MHIGLFGGSFDPPHLGHQQVVKEVLVSGLFDQVWYVPVGNHDFGKKMMPAKDRLAMLELIQQTGTRIESYEIEQPGVSYTHTTLEHFQQTQPEHTFSWIIGSDQLPTLYKWGCDKEQACFPELLSHYTFYVYPRAGYPMELPFEKMIPLQDMSEIKVSSTDIREKLRSGLSITGLVDPAVEQYIKAHHLYT